MTRTSALWSMGIRTIRSQRPRVETSAWSPPQATLRRIWKKVVLSLKAGDVSDPIRPPGAFYIVRVEAKSVQPVNEVRGSIFEELRQAHIGDRLSSLRQRFRPEVKDPAFFAGPGGSVSPPVPPALPK